MNKETVNKIGKNKKSGESKLEDLYVSPVEITEDEKHHPIKKIFKITRSEFGNHPFFKKLAITVLICILIGVGITTFNLSTSKEQQNILLDFFISFAEKEFLLLIAIGFVAQMIDGALGMAYGASCNTMLLSIGTPSTIAIQVIKLSEVFTTAASGISHWRLGNVNKKLFKNLIIPGAIGAVSGSVLLLFFEKAEKYGKYLKPFITFYILLLGIYLIYKAVGKKQKKQKTKKLNLLALFGGFMDAIGGGGWGPIVTSTLISRGRNPKYTIGSVNLAEFFIAFAGALTLTWGIGLSGWKTVVGIMLGGIIAAPAGAFIAGKVKAKPLMILVGVLIILVNSYNIIKMLK